MSQAQYPIDPGLDSQGRIRALIPYLGDAASIPVPLPALDGSWDVNLEARTADTSTYAKLGVSNMISGDATLDRKTVVWDALVGKNTVSDGTGAATVIFQTFWGIGLRVAITYRSTDIKGAVNVSSVAATAEYRRVDVQYEIRSVGLGAREFADVLSTIPPLGQFDMNAFNQLNAVRLQLVKSLQAELQPTAETAARLHPAIVTLAQVPFADFLTEAAECRFTMQSIAADLSCEEALARLGGATWKSVRREQVEALYKELLGDNEKPTPEAKGKARHFLGIDS